MIDLNNLKEQIQTILENANTTTASTDLSSNLETRVQKVLKVNPERIPIQSTWYPFVTVYIDSKEIEETTISKNQATGKRRANVSIKLVGAVWNSTVATEDDDDASNDAESLMENIEEILRNNTTLNSTVTWSVPTGVSYHSLPIEEESSIRAGILDLRATLFY